MPLGTDIDLGPGNSVLDMTQLSPPELECGPMPSVMATLPDIGGALSSTPQSLADAHY